MESNLGQQAPKLNVTNVSSAVFGKDGPALGKESKIGTLSRILRTTRIKVNNVEKVTAVSRDKISRIINILKTQQMTTGEKLPVPKKNEGIGNISETLVETNRILVEIQNQLAYDFAMQVADQKKEEEDKKKERSREKLKAEESALEKSRKRIGKAIAKTTEKAVSPFKGIFDQIKDFVLTVGAGIAVNAAFKWISNEENRKKLEGAFNFIKENWKWILGVSAGMIAFGPIVSVVSSIVSLAGALVTIGGFLFGVLGAPAFLTLLGLIATAGGILFLNDFIRNKTAGGTGFREAIETNYKTIDDIPNITRDGTILSKSVDAAGNRMPFMETITTPDGATVRIPVQVEGRGGFQDPIDISPERMKKYGVTQEQIDIFRQYQKNRGIINTQQVAMEKELKEAKAKIFTGRGPLGGPVANKNFEESEKTEYAAAAERIRAKYNAAIPGMLQFQERAMGGPVMSGKPYLVGESGPELFMPNINGTIIDNTRTEKIYQVLASGRRGRMRTITLPPQVIEGPKPEVEMPLGAATKEPKISSSNPMDGSRSMTSEIYGIMV